MNNNKIYDSEVCSNRLCRHTWKDGKEKIDCPDKNCKCKIRRKEKKVSLNPAKEEKE